MIRNLSDWMQKHRHEVEDLNEGDKVLMACDEATREAQQEEFMQNETGYFIEDYIIDNPEVIKVYEDETGNKAKEEEKYTDEFITWLKHDNNAFGTFNDFLEEKFNDNRTPDNYYPIWAWAWEFPTSYRAEELNKEQIPNLVFFDIDGITYVSLTGCGMDLTPSLEYAYFLLSDLQISKTYIKEKILRQPSYFEYVAGKEKTRELCEKVGITEKKVRQAEELLKKRMEDFNTSLNGVSDIKDQNLRAIAGLSVFFKHQREGEKAVKELAQ